MHTLGRHALRLFLARAAALAGLAGVLGALVGSVEAAGGQAGGAGWLSALARVPETVFFAAPAIVVLAVLWAARDRFPHSAGEGLAGVGVPEGRVDAGWWLGVAGVALAAAAVGGWAAPAVQRLAGGDSQQAWARSGGAPGWAPGGSVWVRVGDRLLRLERDGEAVRVTRALALGSGMLADVPLPATRLPSADELALLARPPAWLSLPELWRAGAVRRAYGHLDAPVGAELALRLALVALIFPCAATALAGRRLRRAGWRWGLVGLLLPVVLLGLQVSTVWAARGELPVSAVVLVPTALACGVAAVGWKLVNGER